jgi:hypothetical protein
VRTLPQTLADPDAIVKLATQRRWLALDAEIEGARGRHHAAITQER